MISCLLPVMVRADNTNYTVFVVSDSYSAPISIKGLLDQWQGDFRGGEVAFTRNRVGVSARRGPWSVTWQRRLDYHFRFSRDTAELFFLEENDIDLPAERRFQLDLQASHLLATSLSVTRYWQPASSFQWQSTVNLIRGSSFQDGEGQGFLSADSTNNQQDFTADIRLDYQYSRDWILDQRAPGPKGWGGSFDVAWQWQLDSNWTINGKLEDLFARIWWQDAPFSDFLGQTERQLGAGGTLQLRGTDDFQQSLPWFGEVQVRRQLSAKIAGELQYRRLDDVDYLAIGALWHQWGVRFHIKRGQLEGFYSRRYFSVSLAIDDPDYQQAQSLSLSFSIHW